MSSIRGRPIFLGLDFDGTVTVKDTMSPLAAVGYKRAEKHNGSLPPLSFFFDEYVKDLNAHKASQEGPAPTSQTASDIKHVFHTKARNPSALARTVDYQRGILPVEQASAKRVADAGLFSHISADEWHIGAREAIARGDVKIRPGLRQLLHRHSEWNRRSLSNPDHEHALRAIVSINFSRSWVDACLKAALKDSPTSLDVQVIANDDTVDPPIDLRTSDQKREKFDSLVQAAVQKSAGVTPVSMYIGDAVTDIECLLAAEVGVCMRDEPMGGGHRELAKALQEAGVNVVHLGAWDVSAERPPNTLYWARDFEDVDQWLARLQS